jgi:cytochrome c oxidase assembly protein subunit 15
MIAAAHQAGDDRARHRAIGTWLLLCCAAIFAMVVLGGVTRLTGSGLSIVEWQPLTGAVPPLSGADWHELFRRYQQFPEFRERNAGMTLAEFKVIFWIEYAHRLLGRGIALLFLLPMLYFWRRFALPTRLKAKLVALFLLGGLQGFVGWYMVQSGLVDVPHVSPYRLAAHLGLAFAIYAGLLWLALDEFAASRAAAVSEPGRRAGLVVVALVYATALSGGLVAGLKAGLFYNTFPTMDGRWLPDGLLALTPAWRNPFENVTTAQFDHRALALLTAIGIAWFWLTSRGAARRRAHLLFAAATLQVALGVATLLLHVPPALAAAHQAGALLLFTAALWTSHGITRSAKPSAAVPSPSPDPPHRSPARNAS